MIERMMRSRVVQGIVLVTGVVITYLQRQQPVASTTSTDSNKPVRFSLNEPAPILDKEGEVHEIGFLFPTASQPLLIIHNPEPAIRCEDGTGKFSHKVFNHTATGLPSTLKCMRVFRETSYFGPDAQIRDEERYYQTNVTKPATPTLRTIMLNTEAKKGICVTDQDKKTYLPSLHVMDFDFLPPGATAENTKAPKWGGTMEEITEALQMADKDLTKAEQACQKARVLGKQDHSGGECERRATIAVRQFARSVYKLGNLTANDKSRMISENTHSVFGNPKTILAAKAAALLRWRRRM